MNLSSLPNLTSSQKSFSGRLSGIRMFSLKKLTWSVAVFIWAPNVLKTLLEMRQGVLESTLQTFTNKLDKGTRSARRQVTVLLFPKRETVLHGISRTFGWIFSGRCFSNSAVHRLPFDWLLNQLFHMVHNLRKGHIRKISVGSVWSAAQLQSSAEG